MSRAAVNNIRPRWALPFFVIVASTQIALPLAPGAAAVLVSATVIALAVASVLIAMSASRPERIGKITVLILLASLMVEITGSKTGFPFGDYSYGSGLEPRIAGVPVIVPLAWLAMALPSWEIARRVSSNGWISALAGGWALMAWDLFLDPLMIDYGYWTWFEGEPAWQGIPLENFLGWFAVGTILTALISRLQGPAGPSAGLAGLYCWMTGFSALGFVLPFAFDRPHVAIVGVAATAPLVIVALRWPASR